LILYVSVTIQIRQKKNHGHTSGSLVISFFLNEYFWQIQVDDNCLAYSVEDSQLFPYIPALNQAVSYLAQTASYLSQCLPVPAYLG
jgi:hypothetical protein